MNDWQIVTRAEPWLIPSSGKARVRPAGQSFTPTRRFEAAFPLLAELLSNARQCEVILPSGTHLLFAWGERDPGLRAWLSPDPPGVGPDKAAPDHRILFECFGGIVERFNEPEDNWLLNHTQALLATEVD